eukprot:6385726-Amphidinium_carterae.1
MCRVESRHKRFVFLVTCIQAHRNLVASTWKCEHGRGGQPWSNKPNYLSYVLLIVSNRAIYSKGIPMFKLLLIPLKKVPEQTRKKLELRMPR